MNTTLSTDYEVLTDSNVMIALRDGVKLATDIYRPARNGKAVDGRFPVILERTPYGKTRARRAPRWIAAKPSRDCVRKSQRYSCARVTS